MPAQRKSRRLVRALKKKSTKQYRFPLKIIFIVFVFLVCLGFVKLLTEKNHWDKTNRLVLAIQQQDGDVLVANIDPVSNEIVTIEIPGNTEVEVSGNLGKWKLSSVWELTSKEKKNINLFGATISTNFYFPVTTWSSSTGEGLINGSLLEFLSSVVTPYRSNLSIGDKIAIGLFSRTVDNINKVSVSLSETGVIKKSELSDGSEGFLITGNESVRLRSYFKDYHILNTPPKINFVSAGSQQKVQVFSKLIETLGTKVLSIDNERDSGEFYCKVAPKENEMAGRISAIMGCELVTAGDRGFYDITVYLGK